jgi:hypothetical protein
MIKKLFLTVVLLSFMVFITMPEIYAIEEAIIAEPSPLAQWFADNIVEVLIGTGTGITLLGTGLGFVIAWLRKKTAEMRAERQMTNQTQLTASQEVTNMVNFIKTNFVTDLKGYMAQIGLTQEQINKVIEMMGGFTNSVTEQVGLMIKGQATTNEILRLMANTNPELVRSGIAEKINLLIDNQTITKAV